MGCEEGGYAGTLPASSKEAMHAAKRPLSSRLRSLPQAGAGLPVSAWTGRRAAAMLKRSGHPVPALDGATTADGLDPATDTAPASGPSAISGENGPVEIDDEIRPISEPAGSWEPTPEAERRIFRLRRGVRRRRHARVHPHADLRPRGAGRAAARPSHPITLLREREARRARGREVRESCTARP